MGQPKLSLLVGGRTVLERLVSALKLGGVERILVVVGAHVHELAVIAKAAGAEALQLTSDTPDMRATVVAGLDHIAATDRPSPDDAWLLAPADHPGVTATLVRGLLVAGTESAGVEVIVPTYNGRRGHPTLIRWRYADDIRKLPTGQGINAFLQSPGLEVRELPVTEPGAVLDLDTPEDYARFLSITNLGAKTATAESRADGGRGNLGAQETEKP
jgi:molybdenum cofactor cytidylyltransferase